MSAAVVVPWLVVATESAALAWAVRDSRMWRRRRAAAERQRDEVTDLRKSERAAHSQRKVELHNALDQIESLQLKLARVATHRAAGEDQGCGKVRLYSRGQADEFIRSLASDTNQPTDWFTAYLCKVCPRQPVGTSRFWHVGHIDPEERTSGTQVKRRAAYHKRGTTPGAQMKERLGQDQIAALKARFATGEAS